MVNTTPPKSLTAQSEFGYGKIFGILVRRKWWIIAAVSIGLVGGTIVNLRSKPTYRSTMQLLVESTYSSRQRSSGDTAAVTDSTIQIDYGTQLSIMRSSQMFERAVEILKPKYPGITANDLFKSLTVGQVSQGQTATKIFQIEFTGKDAVQTREVLQAFKKVYQEYNLTQQKQRLTNGLSFIDEQLPIVKKNIVEATNSIEEFRRKHNLFDAQQRVAEVSNAISNIEQQKRANQIEAEQLKTKIAKLEQDLGLTSEQALRFVRLNQSGRYQAAAGELQKAELNLSQESARFRENTPLIDTLKARFNQAQSLVEQERLRVSGSTAPIKEGAAWNADQGGTFDVNLATQLVELQTSLDTLRSRQEVLATQETQLRAEIARLPKLLTEYEALKPRLQIEQETLQNLLKTRQQLSLEIARGGFDWQVVEEPRIGFEEPPNHRRNLLLGIVAGLFLGIGIALVRDLQDDTVHSSEEFGRQMDLPLLGVTPKFTDFEEAPTFVLPFFKGQKAAPMVANIIEVIRWQPFRESLDLIYKNIELLREESPLTSLVISSALSGEGKSTMALGLATSAARLHQRVLLVDANLRYPVLHRLLQLPNDRGLSTLLTQPDAQLTDVVQSSNASIDILTAGPIPHDSVSLLSSEAMRQFVHHAETIYDLVIIDSTAILGTIEAIQIGSICQGMLLVGRINLVTRSDFSQTLNLLQKLNVVGVVANGVGDLPSYMRTTGKKKDQHTSHDEDEDDA